jgi:hypothetical protein
VKTAAAKILVPRAGACGLILGADRSAPVIAIGSFSGGMSARTQDAEYCVRTIHQRRQDAIPPFQVVSHQCVAHSGSLKDILQKADFSLFASSAQLLAFFRYRAALSPRLSIACPSIDP